MRIALIHNVKLPVLKYGGTERVVWWLAKGLRELGHQVVLACAPGTECDFAEVVAPDFSQSIAPQLPGVDVLHYFSPPHQICERPYLVTIEGNGKAGETFPQNTVFVSRNHAQRHGAEAFVYNGIDPDDYKYSDSKGERLLFLAKARWKVKNVEGAIRISRRSGLGLDILGGTSWLPRWRGVHWRGMLGGTEKIEFLARSRALLFPVVWDEPFGIAVIEALISGTPVLASPFGSLPELVSSEVGRICARESEFVEAVGELGAFSAKRCRDYALEFFTYVQMTQAYLALYEKVLAGQPLNSSPPRCVSDAGALRPLPA